MSLGGLKGVVRDVEGVVNVDGKNAEVEMRYVEGGRGDETFGRGRVRKANEQRFMYGRVWMEGHTLSTPICKVRVA
jgi:hypothetical protein